jgi:hypothetical protein
MKPLLICLALFAAASPAWAQTDPAVEAERARISAERQQAGRAGSGLLQDLRRQ